MGVMDGTEPDSHTQQRRRGVRVGRDDRSTEQRTHDAVTTVLCAAAASASPGQVAGVPAMFSLALTVIALRARTTEDTAQLSGMAQGFGYLLAGLGPFLFGLLYDLTDGQMLFEARWPNSRFDSQTGYDLFKPTLAGAKAGSTGTSIVDPALTAPDGYWDGSWLL